MADAFTGEIRIFGGNYNPRSWALCNGTTLAIGQNTALYSILGTQFGGDGRTSFKVPHLCGRSPMGTSQGPGLSRRYIGQSVGYEKATIDSRFIPSHNHPINVSKEKADLEVPDNESVLANATKKRGNKDRTMPAYAQAAAPINTMNPSMITANSTEVSVSHENRQPYLAMTFILCLEGTYPARS